MRMSHAPVESANQRWVTRFQFSHAIFKTKRNKKIIILEKFTKTRQK